MRKTLITIALCFSFIFVSAINKTEFYKAFAGSDLAAINSYLAELNKEKASDLGNAYKGALLMKKAGIVKSPAEKLDLFKKGAKLLEAEITKSSSNAEFRLLRLVIQENSPSFLGYNKNMAEDKKSILTAYKKLDPIIQNQVRVFAKTSKNISPNELK